MPLFSIITINYNNKSGLQKTIESVRNQTFKDFEYIVIDGGSTDGSKEVIEANQSYFNYSVSEKDRGIYNAINKGLARATGDYVLCLHSGDYLHDNLVLEKIAPVMTGEDIIYGDTFVFNSNHKLKEWLWLQSDVLDFNLFLKGSISHQSAFVRTDFHRKVGFYDEGFKIVSDWKFFLEACAVHKARTKHVKLIVSSFDGSGLSATAKELNNNERAKVLEEFSFFLDHQNNVKILPATKFQVCLRAIKRSVLWVAPYGVVLIYRKMLKRDA